MQQPGISLNQLNASHYMWIFMYPSIQDLSTQVLFL